MSIAEEAVSFLTSVVGAKDVNVYKRAGRDPRLTFKIKGKSFGLSMPVGREESLIPEIREIAAAQKVLMVEPRGVRAVRDLSTPNARLKYAREEATLQRRALADELDIDVRVLAELETSTDFILEDRLSDEQIVNLARICAVDPNWLSGRELIPAPSSPKATPIITNSVTSVPVIDDVQETASRDYVAIGARIKLARTRLGWAQTKLGDKLYMSGTSISLAERGNANGVFSLLLDIGKHLKVNPRWLETGEGDIREEGKKNALTIRAPRPPAPIPPSPNENIVAVLMRQVVQLDEAMRLRHQELLAKQDLTLRYLKAIHRKIMEPPPVKQKSQKRSNAMKAAHARRRAAAESAPENADDN